MSKNVIVLGAGMVGTSTALALQRRGFDVLLIDRRAPGSETSYGNAGVIQGEACEPYSLPREWGRLWQIALKRDNSVDWDLAGLWEQARPLMAYWHRSAPARHRRISAIYSDLVQKSTADHAYWIAASGSDSLIRRSGYRLVLRDARSFANEVRKAELWRDRYGVDSAYEDSATLAAAEPALRRAMAGAIHWKDAWTCADPGALVRAYANLFVQRGGTLIQGEARALLPMAAGWKIEANADSIEAANVVVALGPWSPHALSPLGYKINMVRKRGYHMHFMHPPVASGSSVPSLNLPLIDADVGAVYAPMRAGLRVATGADLSSAAPVSFPRQLRRAEAAARELLDLGPQVEQRAWAGVRPCMPDMLPMVGAAPRHPGLWFNFGHGHQGFTLGPTTGELLAKLVAGDTPPDANPLARARLVGHLQI